jgi:transposase
MRQNPSPEAIPVEQQILRAAQKVLASQKVSGTRVREIAHQAGISQGTLHYYFPSKTGLYLRVLDEMQKFFERRQKQLMSHELDPREKILLFADQQRQLLIENPQAEEIFLDFWGHAMVDGEVHDKILSMYAAWRRDIRVAVEQGVQAGVFGFDRARVAPYIYVALMEGIALQYLPDKTQIDLEGIFQAVNSLMLDWLRGERISEEAGSARKPYPSDMNDAQWRQICSLIGPAKEGGRPRSADLREITNALLYMAHNQCSWRMLPHDFPGWQTVYAYYHRWSADGTLEKIGVALRVDLTQIGVEK